MVNYSTEDTTKALKKLPSLELQKEFQDLGSQYSIGFSKWEFNPEKKEITLYFYSFGTYNENGINRLQGKQIGNYTIRVIHDIEFETTKTEVYEQLSQFRKNPEYQISHISMETNAFGDPPGNYAELWVYKSTPENKKLDNTVIQGWKIQVYPVSK